MVFLSSNQHVPVPQQLLSSQINFLEDYYTICLLDDHFYLVSLHRPITFLESLC